MTTPPPPVTGPPGPKQPDQQQPDQQPTPLDQPTTEGTDDDDNSDDDDTEPSGGPPTQRLPPADGPAPAGYRSKIFWIRTAERAIKSTAQVLVLILVTDTATGGVDVTEINWPRALGMALGGGLLSILTSIISKPFGADPNTPSTVD